MKKNLLIATLMMTLVVSFSVVPTASAQDCNVPSFFSDLVKKLRDECKKLEGDQANTSTCTKKQATLIKLIDAWNGIVANSPLRLGPRDIEFGNVQTGNLLAPANRRFISQIIEEGKGVTVSVKKRDNGNADCIVNICAVDLNTGAQTGLSSDTIKGSAAVGTEVKKTFSASQVGNKVLIVLLDGKGVGTRFPYSFTATKN